MRDIDELLHEIGSLRTGGARYAAFFAVMAYAGMRPSEVAGLQIDDLDLPASGWGVARLRAARPSPGTRYTETSSTRQVKALKHRADGEVRSVPLPPVLVDLLNKHLKQWPPVAGLVFTNAAGNSVTPENYSKVWLRLRSSVWPEGHVAADAVPYDLRHSAASMMIRAGVPLGEISRRLGHSVDVLLRTYAGVFESDLIEANSKIDEELGRLGPPDR
ncbi:MAG: site-specific integrase [Actinomycetota bacterium]